MTKDELFELGKRHITAWCGLHEIEPPKVNARSGTPDFGVCAYYRDGEIEIWVNSCAAVGLAGRAWSYPGYCVDRTPYGVLAHELGHHVDGAHGPAGGNWSHRWYPLDPEPLTSYCPNANEWFAEWFRLWVTNPDLLRALKPGLADLMSKRWPHEAEQRGWQAVLLDSPRHVQAASNRIKRAGRRSGQSRQLGLPSGA